MHFKPDPSASRWLTILALMLASAPGWAWGDTDGEPALSQDPWATEAGARRLQEQPPTPAEATYWPRPGQAGAGFYDDAPKSAEPAPLPPPLSRPAVPLAPFGPYPVTPPLPPAPTPFMGGGMPGPMGPPTTDISELMWSLDLSDAQRQALTDLSAKLRREKWRLLGEVMDHNGAIRRLEAEQRHHARAIAELSRRIDGVTARAREEALGLLTEEQRAQLGEIQQQLMSPGRLPPPRPFGP